MNCDFQKEQTGGADNNSENEEDKIGKGIHDKEYVKRLQDKLSEFEDSMRIKNAFLKSVGLNPEDNEIDQFHRERYENEIKDVSYPQFTVNYDGRVREFITSYLSKSGIEFTCKDGTGEDGVKNDSPLTALIFRGNNNSRLYSAILFSEFSKELYVYTDCLSRDLKFDEGITDYNGEVIEIIENQNGINEQDLKDKFDKIFQKFNVLEDVSLPPVPSDFDLKSDGNVQVESHNFDEKLIPSSSIFKRVLHASFEVVGNLFSYFWF